MFVFGGVDPLRGMGHGGPPSDAMCRKGVVESLLLRIVQLSLPETLSGVF